MLSSGLPDVAYTIEGVHGWIELKVIHPGGKIFFERFQLPWFSQRLKPAKGKGLWILATDNNALFLYAAGEVLKAPRERVARWTVVKTSDLTSTVMGLKPWPWKQVHEALVYGPNGS